MVIHTRQPQTIRKPNPSQQLIEGFANMLKQASELKQEEKSLKLKEQSAGRMRNMQNLESMEMAHRERQRAGQAASQEAQMLGEALGIDLTGLPPETIKEFGKQFAKTSSRKQLFENLGLTNLMSPDQQMGEQSPMESVLSPSDEIKVGLKSSGPENEIPEQVIFAVEAAGEHGLAQQLRETNKRIFEDKKIRRKVFEADRKFHTEFSKKAEADVEGLRASLPKKEMSLNFARDAIESGELDYFSLNKLADITGSDVFRTAKGAQLITASKENLLSNMSRVTGRAQNMWFEQRLNSMFPKIGQSDEANLTVQEMLEGEVALDKAYLNEFDKIVERDQQDYGYVRKDVSKRAHEAIKPMEKDIMQRTTYRMKEIEEREKGAKSLKSKVGENVPKGTPLTLQMLALYDEKFGDNAIKVAQKNGYFVPTYEEWKLYSGASINE